MKSHTVYLTFNTEKRKEIIPIPNEVERIIRESGIQEGPALVSCTGYFGYPCEKLVA